MWIIEHFPPRCQNPNKPDADDPGWLHYVEPYFGGGSVMLANDPAGISEVANDLNWALTNFWVVLQQPALFLPFRELCEATPFSEPEWKSCDPPLQAYEENRAFTGNEHAAMIAAAHVFFVRCRQSMSGRMKSFAPLTRNRTRQGMNEQASAWLSAIEGLPAIHERLKRVVILNRPAVEVIKQQDGPRTLFYCDPPYVHESRSTKTEYGSHEMSDDDHEELLLTLAKINGRFVLSGYPSELYAGFEKRHGWRTDTLLIDNKSSKADEKDKKTEVLWMNF